jgi:hypothetical protein
MSMGGRQLEDLAYRMSVFHTATASLQQNFGAHLGALGGALDSMQCTFDQMSAREHFRRRARALRMSMCPAGAPPASPIQRSPPSYAEAVAEIQRRGVLLHAGLAAIESSPEPARPVPLQQDGARVGADAVGVETKDGSGGDGISRAGSGGAAAASQPPSAQQQRLAKAQQVEVDALKDENARLRERNRGLTAERDLAQRRALERQVAMDRIASSSVEPQLRAENRCLSDRVAELQRERVEIQSEHCEELRGNREQLTARHRDELHEVEQRHGDRERDLNATITKLRGDLERHARRAAETDEMSQRADHAEERANRAEQQHREKTAELATAREESQRAADARRQAARDRHDESARTIEQLQARIAELEQQLELLRAKYQAASMLVPGAMEEIDAAASRGTLTRVHMQLQRLVKQVHENNLDGERERFHAAAAELQARLAQHAAERESCERQQRQLENERDEAWRARDATAAQLEAYAIAARVQTEKLVAERQALEQTVGDQHNELRAAHQYFVEQQRALATQAGERQQEQVREERELPQLVEKLRSRIVVLRIRGCELTDLAIKFANRLKETRDGRDDVVEQLQIRCRSHKALQQHDDEALPEQLAAQMRETREQVRSLRAPRTRRADERCDTHGVPGRRRIERDASNGDDADDSSDDIAGGGNDDSAGDSDVAESAGVRDAPDGAAPSSGDEPQVAVRTRSEQPIPLDAVETTRTAAALQIATRPDDGTRVDARAYYEWRRASARGHTPTSPPPPPRQNAHRSAKVLRRVVSGKQEEEQQSSVGELPMSSAGGGAASAAGTPPSTSVRTRAPSPAVERGGSSRAPPPAEN